MKGENAAITARKRQTFGPVYEMDIENPKTSARFNPLDIIRFNTPHAPFDAKRISQLLHPKDPTAEHWDEKSTGGIAALILYVMEKYHHQPALRTLTQVRALLTQTQEDFVDTLQEMASHSGQAYVRQKARAFLNMQAAKSNELTSIISTMEKATELFSAGSPASYLTSVSDFDLATFNDTSQTIYVIIPENDEFCNICHVGTCDQLGEFSNKFFAQFMDRPTIPIKSATKKNDGNSSARRNWFPFTAQIVDHNHLNGYAKSTNIVI